MSYVATGCPAAPALRGGISKEAAHAGIEAGSLAIDCLGWLHRLRLSVIGRHADGIVIDRGLRITNRFRAG